MVYRGKLSKACLPCRRRKLLCDLKDEGCSQCRRAKLLCHGYRNTEALRLTDESMSVQRKVQGPISSSTLRYKSKSRTSLPPSPPPRVLAPIFRYAGVIPQSLSIPMASQARDLFYYNYVVGMLKPLDFLESICAPTSKDEHLSASMDAVALAYLNYQCHAPDAQSAARRAYVAALRLMNKAIQDPELARRDSTMLAILLLDLYEKITNQEPQYEGAWAAHLQGALTLVQMRGEKQFEDPIALRMLARVTTNGIISSVASHRPIPDEIMALRANIAAHSAIPDPKARESELMIEFAGLRNELDDGDLHGDAAVSTIRDLDDRFLALSLDTQPPWQYKTVHVEVKSRHHWETYHHMYPNEQIGQMWNALRLARIMLNESILSLCVGVDDVKNPHSHPTSLRQKAHATIQRMISDICASVPQYIGDLSDRDLGKSTGTPARPFTRLNAPDPTQHLPCYRLIYPLYVAAQSSAAPVALRIWVISQLRFMANYHAMPNAARVATILESGERRDPWLVYVMLGSYAFVC